MKLLIVALLLFGLSVLVSIDSKLETSNLSAEEKQVLVQERAEQQLAIEQSEALNQQRIERVSNTPWGELSFEDQVFRLFFAMDSRWIAWPLVLLFIITLFNITSKARAGGYG